MKRSFPININNTIYYIDEDAYDLLNTYLDRLRQTFTGKEGDEIISDIECRINELFSLRAKNSIITIEEVNSVIEIMGHPEDLGETQDTISKETDYKSDNVNIETGSAQKRLYRDPDNKVLGGVLSGLAIKYDWNVTILRILVIFIGLCSAIFPVTLVYLASWMIIPVAATPRQKLQMHGRPITVESIGRDLCNDTSDPTGNATADTLGALVNIFAKAALALFSISAAFLLAATAIGLLITLLCAIGYSFGSEQWMYDTFGITIGEGYPIPRFIGMASFMLAVAIPAAAVFWTGCTVFFKAKGAKKTLIIAAVITEIICIVTAIIMIAASNSHNNMML